ncbi:SpoIIE family protein phosphatase [Hyphobacterium sp. CCMP332]|nr:SpoIIE family protein phosphatase [Hyphobacterium sp. CCMP332]
MIITAWVSYENTRKILTSTSKQKSELISDEIHHVFKEKELKMEGLEQELEDNMARLSNRLINYYFNAHENLEKVNLDSIRNILGVDTSLVDLYIVDTNGIVVNTTMTSDLNLNLFSFGPEFSKFLKERFEDDEFYSSRFGVEIKTNNLKKYSYEKTNDDSYLVEIGHYSPRADKIISTFNKRLDSISSKQKGILDVELYVDDHNPLTLNKAKNLKEIHRRVLRQTFSDKTSHTLIEIEDGIKIHYEYIYSKEEDEPEELASVVRIKSNKSIEEELLRGAIRNSLYTFGAVILLLILMLYINSRTLLKPLSQLNEKLDSILDGDESSIEIEGNQAFSTLADRINGLLKKLKSSERQVSSQNSKIEEQQDQIKTKNEGVVDSLRYAKKIQSALFPSINHVNNIFPNHLLFYKPLSVVSGDFYWMEEENDYKYFAVVDCTGHGVTGAFISLVGLNSLNRTIREFKMTDPSEILEKVNELVESTLQQKDAEIKDGMDIALCAYSKKEKKLYYCGANSPIFIIREAKMGNLIINKSWTEPDYEGKDFSFYEIKGNRKSIGGIEVKDEKFNNVEIEIKENDTIYLFTDGIADQIGGEHGKKFRARNLREMVKEMQNLPLQEQNSLIDEKMIAWMMDGKYEQIDDMCMIAIKFSQEDNS